MKVSKAVERGWDNAYPDAEGGMELGMTIRETMAMHAMQGLLAEDTEEKDLAIIADLSVEAADRLLEMLHPEEAK